ncbi:MAG: DUF5017 domain-containing protein [Paludibacter sp.]|nr:DUF5017 domain-containing protein [Paludibacter sp.]
MKIKYILFSFSLLVLFSSCENELMQEVSFDVTVAPKEGLTITDTLITAAKGSTIHFNFTGDPDFISFSYERFIATNAELNFSTQAAWGTHVENSLSVYVSDEFPGLALNKFALDSVAIVNHSWTNVSTLSNLPTVVNVKKQAVINMNEYRGKNVVIAFQYHPNFIDDWQPTWMISDLNIRNTLVTDNSLVSTYLAATMGFSPFDMLKKDSTAYKSESVAGVWYVNNPAAIEIKRTARANPLNNDWLISKPIAIPLGLTETSAVTPLKNISYNIESYDYKFDKPGTYVISFKASNRNYKVSSSKVETVKVLITND